nr:hypothetical protein [Pseudomonas sp. HS-2]
MAVSYTHLDGYKRQALPALQIMYQHDEEPEACLLYTSSCV